MQSAPPPLFSLSCFLQETDSPRTIVPALYFTIPCLVHSLSIILQHVFCHCNLRHHVFVHILLIACRSWLRASLLDPKPQNPQSQTPKPHTPKPKIPQNSGPKNPKPKIPLNPKYPKTLNPWTLAQVRGSLSRRVRLCALARS